MLGLYLFNNIPKFPLSGRPIYQSGWARSSNKKPPKSRLNKNLFFIHATCTMQSSDCGGWGKESENQSDQGTQAKGSFISTWSILLKFLTPVNTVKSPESELLSCRQRQRMTPLSPRMEAKDPGPGVKPARLVTGGSLFTRRTGASLSCSPLHPQHLGVKRRKTWGLSRRDTPLMTASVLERVPPSLPDSRRVWFSH